MAICGNGAGFAIPPFRVSNLKWLKKMMEWGRRIISKRANTFPHVSTLFGTFGFVHIPTVESVSCRGTCQHHMRYPVASYPSVHDSKSSWNVSRRFSSCHVFLWVQVPSRYDILTTSANDLELKRKVPWELLSDWTFRVMQKLGNQWLKQRIFRHCILRKIVKVT